MSQISILTDNRTGVEVREYIETKYRAAVKALRDFDAAYRALALQDRQVFSTLNRHSFLMAETAIEMFGEQISMFGEGL